MAQPVEPLDIDVGVCEFDNKENSFHHNNVAPRTPCTEKGYEELDVSELNMKLRYSGTPASSPMSKSFTASCLDNRNLESDSMQNCENGNMTRSLHSTLKNESTAKVPKVLPLQVLSTDQGQIMDGNRNALRPIDTTATLTGNNVTVTITTSETLNKSEMNAESDDEFFDCESTFTKYEFLDCESTFNKSKSLLEESFKSIEEDVPPQTAEPMDISMAEVHIDVVDKVRVVTETIKDAANRETEVIPQPEIETVADTTIPIVQKKELDNKIAVVKNATETSLEVVIPQQPIIKTETDTIPTVQQEASANKIATVENGTDSPLKAIIPQKPIIETETDIKSPIILQEEKDQDQDKEISVYNLRSESKELKDRLANLESQTRSWEAVSAERMKKINELNDKLTEKTKANRSMAEVVEEYERTLASLITETEQDRNRHAEERLQLIKERDEQRAHLASMEVSFSDLHSKYEKAKQIILGFKAADESYRKSIKESEENIEKLDKNYELLKQHATAKLTHANEELQKINRAHESEVQKLKALIKRKALDITSLEESLQQKTKENDELTEICDELINKVG